MTTLPIPVTDRKRPLRIILALLALVIAPVQVGAQIPGDTFANDQARELLRLARERRNTVDRRIQQYNTTARERFSVGVQANIAKKLVYRRETVSRIDWQRDGAVRMDVLAMREVAPIASAKTKVPDDISAELVRLAFDPAEPDLLIPVDSGFVRYPLADNSEAHYRFAAGGTTVLTLPDGRSVRLRELRFEPRRRDPRLIAGSFWLESGTHAIVQAYFKLARAFDGLRDGSGGFGVSTAPDTTNRDANQGVFTLSDIPGLFGPVRAEVDHVAIEYGLYDQQWWLPRLVTARGAVQVNRFHIPFAYERTYDAFAVTGDSTVALSSSRNQTSQACRELVRYTVSTDDPTRDAARDSVRQARMESERARRERWDDQRRAMRGDTVRIPDCPRQVFISAARDSLLLHSNELPADFAGDVELLTDGELRKISDYVRALPGAPWRIEPTRLQWGIGGPGLLRYNRVEGLSIGARQPFELGPAALTLEARFGLADREPRGEIAFERTGVRLRTGIAAYRRLQSATSSTAAHGTLASFGALLFGRDDNDYFDAIGAEIRLQPPASQTQWFDLRMYAERQRAVERNTRFSVANLIDSDHNFRGNFAADAADQFGARVRLRTSYGINPAAPRIAGELSLGGETGDYTFLRPEALLRVQSLLFSGLSLNLEGAAGTVEGDVPAQALWRLGGATTLRGYPGSTLVGERFWRARGELGAGPPAAQMIVFSDVGWAGAHNSFEARGTRSAIGIGGSFLDGLVRADLARGLRSPGGWRLHLQFTTPSGY